MKILICDQLNEKVLDELKTLGDCFDISLSNNKDDEINENIVDSEIVVIRSGTVLNREILELGKNIKIIARCGVGVDNIDLEFAKEKEIAVTNAPSANIISVVELTSSLILNAARKIPQADQSLKNGKWERASFMGVELFGKQLGIVGFGKAGKLLAERMMSFGMQIVFYDPYIKDWDGPEQSTDLDTLLSTSDVVSVHVIKTDETKNLLSKNKLDLMKKGSIIVNTSRGGVLDEDYLIELLSSEHLYGAGLDVYENEPPPNTEQFRNLNITSTPHIGASTKEAQLKAGLDTVENIKKILSGDFSATL
jgi:D-3-phosphoglycerate dehydrogenase